MNTKNTFYLLLIFFPLLVLGQDYKPRRVRVSIDSICTINVKHPEILQRDGFPHQDLETTAREITKYVSNYIQSYAREYGYTYLPNYKRASKQESDVTIKLVMQEERNRHALHTGNDMGYIRLEFWLDYKLPDEAPERAMAIALGGTKETYTDYHDFLEEIRKWAFPMMIKYLFDPSLNYEEVHNPSKTKFVGINDYFGSTMEVDSTMLTTLTHITGQVVLKRIERHPSQDTEAYTYASNYRTTDDTALDYEIKGYVRQTGNYTYLALDWVEVETGQIVYSSDHTMHTSIIKQGNYLELMMSLFDLGFLKP